MRFKLTSAALALLVATVGAGAHAQSKTREQVRQDLVEAVRNGTLPRGEIGPGDASPHPDPMTQRTRAEVRAELEAALRGGDILAAGESDQKLNELHRSPDARQRVMAGKSRAQVLAELAEAKRDGELMAAGESSLTERELHPGLYRRAAAPMLARAAASAPMAAGQAMR